MRRAIGACCSTNVSLCRRAVVGSARSAVTIDPSLPLVCRTHRCRRRLQTPVGDVDEPAIVRIQEAGKAPCRAPAQVGMLLCSASGCEVHKTHRYRLPPRSHRKHGSVDITRLQRKHHEVITEAVFDVPNSSRRPGTRARPGSPHRLQDWTERFPGAWWRWIIVTSDLSPGDDLPSGAPARPQPPGLRTSSADVRAPHRIRDPICHCRSHELLLTAAGVIAHAERP